MCPENPQVQSHVNQVVKLLHEMPSSSMLRALVWPFYIAGCLASEDMKAQFRDLVTRPMQESIHKTLLRASKLMELVWLERETTDGWQRHPWTFLETETDLVLLV